MQKLVALSLLVFLPACLNTGPGGRSSNQDTFEEVYGSDPLKAPAKDHGLRKGQVLIQGMLGATMLDEVQRTGGTNPADGDSTDGLSQMPLIGGNWQMVMGGDRLDWGVEVGGSLGWRSSQTYVNVGSSGLVVAMDVDMFMLDLSGGPFASINLGEKLRAYGAIGPLMQFVNYEHESKDPDVFINESSTGFGLGWYSRLGIELAVSNALMVGLGARWVDSRVDLSDGLGDLDVKGSQVFLTFTTGF